MQQRPLGKTGLPVSEIGYGAWGIGQREWIGAEDEQSMRSLHLAVEEGVTFFDTALAYGEGHSEQLVGRLLRRRLGLHRTSVSACAPMSPRLRFAHLCRAGTGILAS